LLEHDAVGQRLERLDGSLRLGFALVDEVDEDRRIDRRAAGLGHAEAPERVVALLKEAERVDQVVAARAGRLVGHGLDPLAFGWERTRLRQVRVDAGRGWRLHLHAHDLAQPEGAALDRACAVRT
jgi:hypothetical protein